MGKLRRGRLEGARGAVPSEITALSSAPPSWDYTARPAARTDEPSPEEPPALRAQILSLFADPRVHTLSVDAIARLVERPRQDIETTLDALAQAGELERDPAAALPQYRVSPQQKHQLELLFRDAAQELGETGVLATRPSEEALATLDDETEEPRLPVTAGLLSLFLPGTGQLLNGDVGRASLVFAVWSLAWITHLSPVWTFVCLYAGAEAFFTAKIRSMERKMAKEAISGATPPALPPPKPQST